MADTEQGPKKRRAPQGPRTPKPVFAIVTYTDDQGQTVQLDRSRLSIAFERDASAIVELLAGDGNLNASAIVRVSLPAPAQRAKKEAASA